MIAMMMMMMTRPHSFATLPRIGRRPRRISLRQRHGRTDHNAAATAAVLVDDDPYTDHTCTPCKIYAFQLVKYHRPQQSNVELVDVGSTFVVKSTRGCEAHDAFTPPIVSLFGYIQSC